ncbi:MAG: hypothetical protein Q7K29_02550 [Thermoleophilia bacterium]|nr:hypothetical protein [Thermoleophilia bacterium]
MVDKAGVTQSTVPGPSVEQKRYGKILDIAMKVGLLILVITFVLYLIGVPKPHIPVGDVSNTWGLKVSGDEGYLKATGIEKGWSWATHLNQSDFLTFAPIAFLASVTVICYLSILPIFLKRKDYIYASLAVLEVLVLVLAASGVLPTGGH